MESFPLDILLKAIDDCARGVAWKSSVLRWKIPSNKLRFAVALKKELDSKTYKVSPFTTFYVTEPKSRLIHSPMFRDRVVQWTMYLNGLYDDLMHDAVADSCACQLGKGTLYATKRMTGHLHDYFRHNGTSGWCLRLDIHHFFYELRHDVLHQLVDEKVSNPDFRRILHMDIDCFDDPGLGLGCPSHQMLANTYLHKLDHFIKEKLRIHWYLRYSDDIVILHPSKKYLQYCRKAIEEELAKIGLHLNEKSCLHPISQGVNFLKFRYRLTPTGCVIRRMTTKPVKRYRRHLRTLIARANSGEIPLSKIRDSLSAWMSRARQGHNESIISNVWRYAMGLLPQEAAARLDLQRKKMAVNSTADPPIVRYSKYKIQLATEKRNLWQQVKEAIAAAGKTDSWNNIQDIASNNPELVATLPAIRQAFGSDLVDAVLQESIID